MKQRNKSSKSSGMRKNVDDSILGRDKDGTLNEEYCKWCYADGTYTYNDMDELIDVCVKNMVNENFTEEQARSYLKEMLPKLDYWKRYDELSDNGQFEEFKKQLMNEIKRMKMMKVISNRNPPKESCIEEIRQGQKMILWSDDNISISMIFNNLTGQNFKADEYKAYIRNIAFGKMGFVPGTIELYKVLRDLV